MKFSLTCPFSQKSAKYISIRFFPSTLILPFCFTEDKMAKASKAATSVGRAAGAKVNADTKAIKKSKKEGKLNDIAPAGAAPVKVSLVAKLS